MATQNPEIEAWLGLIEETRDALATLRADDLQLLAERAEAMENAMSSQLPASRALRVAGRSLGDLLEETDRNLAVLRRPARRVRSTMGTLSGLLNLAQSSLEANQAAIDITSNNVANQATAGYTRQVAVWQESDSVSLSGSSSVPSGATVSAVSQRDRVLDQRVQQQTQLQSSTAAESSALTQLQTIFGISATSTSATSTAIGSSVDAFFSALTQLQASPADSSVRQAVPERGADAGG